MDDYDVRFTAEAEEDLIRLYDFLLPHDIPAAERALTAIQTGIDLLRFSPFSCRKAAPHNSLLRELIIPFGATGYVALFEVEPPNIVTVLAVRHQREDDCW